MYWVPVLQSLFEFILSMTQGPTIWVPGLLGSLFKTIDTYLVMPVSRSSQTCNLPNLRNAIGLGFREGLGLSFWQAELSTTSQQLVALEVSAACGEPNERKCCRCFHNSYGSKYPSSDGWSFGIHVRMI